MVSGGHVFLVTAGEYADQQVLASFESEQDAERLVGDWNAQPDIPSDMRVEVSRLMHFPAGAYEKGDVGR